MGFIKLVAALSIFTLFELFARQKGGSLADADKIALAVILAGWVTHDTHIHAEVAYEDDEEEIRNEDDSERPVEGHGGVILHRR